MISYTKDKIASTLRWSEKYLKTDIMYLAKGSFWLGVGQILAIVLNLILSVILARVLSKDVYGNYKFILSIAGIIGGLSLSGLSTALNQSVARGYDSAIFSAVKTQLKWGNVVAFVALCVSLFYYLNNNIVVSVSLLFISIAMPITNSTGLYGSFLSGKKDFGRNTLYWFISQSLNILVTIATVFFTQNVVILVFVYFFSNLAT